MEEPRVDELQELARAGDALTASRLALPGLRTLAEARFGTTTTDDVHALVDEAAATLPERQGAACRTLFGDGEGRWTRNLTDRRAEAARELGMSADKLRKKRDGVSPYDELAGSLVDAMEAVAAEPATASEPRPPAPSRPWWLVVLVAVLVLVVGAVVAAAVASRPDDTASDDTASDDTAGDVTAVSVADEPGEGPSVPVDDCDIPVGGAFGGEPPTTAVVEALAEAHTDHDDGPGCPVAVVNRWDALWIQPITADRDPGAEPSWWLVAHDDASVALVVPDVLYDGYFRIADPGGTLAQSTAGLPVAVVDAGTHVELQLDTGGLVVAEGAHAPARWLTADVADLWRELDGAVGAMGLPMTDPNYVDGVPRQDFAGGYGRLVDGAYEVEVLDEATIEADVAALGRATEMILETFDRTSWWIDATGRRRWIPDGGVWACLGGEDARVGPVGDGRVVGGWVVARFPLGPPATCP